MRLQISLNSAVAYNRTITFHRNIVLGGGKKGKKKKRRKQLDFEREKCYFVCEVFFFSKNKGNDEQ